MPSAPDLLRCDKHIADSSGKHTCTRVGTSPVCEPFRTLNAVTCKPEGSPRLPDRPPCIILPISSGPCQLPSTIQRGTLRRCPWAIDHLTTLVWQDAEGDGASRLAGRLLRQQCTQAVRQRHSQQQRMDMRPKVNVHPQAVSLTHSAPQTFCIGIQLLLPLPLPLIWMACTAPLPPVSCIRCDIACRSCV